ncbi:ABC transporter substrate-binding protein, partial [Rhizobium ruizarguesonis]
VAGFIESVTALDPATVKIALKQPDAPLTSLLAFNNSAAIIIPSEKQDEPMKDFIGTGPYMLKERKANQYIQLVRFDG